MTTMIIIVMIMMTIRLHFHSSLRVRGLGAWVVTRIFLHIFFACQLPIGVAIETICTETIPAAANRIVNGGCCFSLCVYLLPLTSSVHSGPDAKLHALDPVNERIIFSFYNLRRMA